MPSHLLPSGHWAGTTPVQRALKGNLQAWVPHSALLPPHETGRVEELGAIPLVMYSWVRGGLQWSLPTSTPASGLPPPPTATPRGLEARAPGSGAFSARDFFAAPGTGCAHCLLAGRQLDSGRLQGGKQEDPHLCLLVRLLSERDQPPGSHGGKGGRDEKQKPHL